METESHLFSLTTPKGTGRHKAMQLLRTALEAQGHPVSVHDAVDPFATAAPPTGPRHAGGLRMSLSADAVPDYLARRYGDAVLSLSAGKRDELAGMVTLRRIDPDDRAAVEGFCEGARWQREQLAARGLK